MYKKQYTITRRFLAHDPENKAKFGDLVLITEGRPISARKTFVLTKVLEKASSGYEEHDAVADLPEEPKPEKIESEEPKAEKNLAAQEEVKE
jgi:hypothetical protein